MKLYIYSLILLLLVKKGFTQDPVYRNISNINGLPSNTVYNMLQDNTGFIWLAHDKGLCRYDGKVFKAYKSDSKQGRSLSNLLQINNQIWCQDFSGNYYYNKGDSLLNESRFKTSGAYTVTGVINKNTLVSIKSNIIQAFDVEKEISTNTLITGSVYTGLYYDKNLVQYILNNKLYSYDGSKNICLSSTLNNLPPIFFLQKLGNHLLAFTKNSYPYCFEIIDNNAKPVEILKPGLFIQDVNVINNELWICTSSGAYCFDERLKIKYDSHCFFNGTSITKVLKDRENNYWFSTINKGINLVPNINTRLFIYNNESLTSIAVKRKNLLIGTANNRLLLFDTTNTFSPIYKEPNNHEVIHIFNDEANNSIIFCSDKFIKVKNNTKITDESSAIKSITIINKDLYAAAYASGICLIARSPNGLDYIPKWLQFPESIKTKTQYKFPLLNFRGRWVLFHEPTQTLYTATTGGLFYFNKLGNGKILKNGQDIYASQLISDEDGIYAATFNDGLLKINPDNTATALFKDDADNNIYKIYKSNKWIWMIGDDKLLKYNIENKQVIKYSTANGLPKAELKDLVILNNKAFIASTAGLVILNENDYQLETIPPILSVNSFLVNNRSIDAGNEVNLANHENNITINFSILSFKADEVKAVQYKINNGLWQNIEANARELNLPALSPGDYSVQIQAINNDNIKTLPPLQFNFSIANPFYKRWWFYSLLFTLCFALIYLYFKFKLKSEKKNNELLSQKIKLEQQLQQSMLASIKSQMNPHFLFNALNTIQSYIYTNDKENASQYLGKFSELTRSILDMSNKDIVSLADEVKSIKLYLELEAQRFEDKLLYEFYVDEMISIETTYIPSMLIQPYIENAIKHGLLHSKNPWLLKINFTKNQEGISVTIDDNGVGRKKSEELNEVRRKTHQSFANNANQKRLEILNSNNAQNISLQIIDKLDKHGNPLGTRVILQIPISKGSR